MLSGEYVRANSDWRMRRRIPSPGSAPPRWRRSLVLSVSGNLYVPFVLLLSIDNDQPRTVVARSTKDVPEGLSPALSVGVRKNHHWFSSSLPAAKTCPGANPGGVWDVAAPETPKESASIENRALCTIRIGVSSPTIKGR